MSFVLAAVPNATQSCLLPFVLCPMSVVLLLGILAVPRATPASVHPFSESSSEPSDSGWSFTFFLGFWEQGTGRQCIAPPSGGGVDVQRVGQGLPHNPKRSEDRGGSTPASEGRQPHSAGDKHEACTARTSPTPHPDHCLRTPGGGGAQKGQVCSSRLPLLPPQFCCVFSVQFHTAKLIHFCTLSSLAGGGGGGGGGGHLESCQTPADQPAHPHQKTFPPGKNQIYRRGPRMEPNFRCLNFLGGASNLRGGEGGCN